MKYLLLLLVMSLITISCETHTPDTPEIINKEVKGTTIDVKVTSDFWDGTFFYTMIYFDEHGIESIRSRNPVSIKGYDVICTFETRNTYEHFFKYSFYRQSNFKKHCKVKQNKN